MATSDGQPFMKSMGASIRPRFGGDVSSAAVNLILQLQRIKFDLFADYALRLEVDDEEVASLPLRVASLR